MLGRGIGIHHANRLGFSSFGPRISHRFLSTDSRRSVRLSGFASSHFCFLVVPQQSVYVLERFGKFYKALGAGLHFAIPFMDRVSYIHSLKEEAVPIAHQVAITADNVTMQINGVLYYKIDDSFKASYGVENPIYALTQLAQTTMRSELGKLTLDKTFQERDGLNHGIVASINEASEGWGIKCMRYEIQDIVPPVNVRHAMELQAEAERKKRAEILQSEGELQARVNEATGRRRSAILEAEGEAEAIRERARATAQGIVALGQATSAPGGKDAVALHIAEQYVKSFGNIAKQSSTLVVPADASNISSMVGTALAAFKTIGGSFGGRSEPSEGDAPVDEKLFDGIFSPKCTEISSPQERPIPNPQS